MHRALAALAALLLSLPALADAQDLSPQEMILRYARNYLDYKNQYLREVRSA